MAISSEVAVQKGKVIVLESSPYNVAEGFGLVACVRSQVAW